MNTIDELVKDCRNDELPSDLSAYDKVKTPLRAGMVVGWYFSDDKEFWDKDGLNCREYTQYSGIIVPAPDTKNGGGELEAEDCVVVMTNYPTEKEYPEVTYFALRRLLNNLNLIEVFDESSVVKG